MRCMLGQSASSIVPCSRYYRFDWCAVLNTRQDGKGQNALMVAAKGGHDSAVEILLEAGTPWNAIDKEGYCAGDLASLAGHESTVDILLEAGVHV